MVHDPRLIIKAREKQKHDYSCVGGTAIDIKTNHFKGHRLGLGLCTTLGDFTL